MASQSIQLRLNTTQASSSHNTDQQKPQNSLQFILKQSNYQISFQFHSHTCYHNGQDEITTYKLTEPSASV